jgi:CDP-diacylglycerol---serine O-phosphatidyltransferase
MHRIRYHFFSHLNGIQGRYIRFTEYYLKQLANMITLIRILGVGVIFWLTPYTNNKTQIFIIILFTLICCTDFLDGWVARRLKIVSSLGQVLDPLADKILVLLFLPLLEMQVITSFPVFIILAREFAMMGLRIYSVQTGGSNIPAQFAGKLKTALTLPVCGILFARVPIESVPLPYLFEYIDILRLWVFSWHPGFVLFLVYGVVAVTVWSFVDYFDHFLWGMYLKRWNNNEEKARHALRAWIPNLFSILNLTFGVLGVYFAIHMQFRFTALLLVFSVVCDAIDGSLARKLNVETKLGAFLDSASDLVSFGILPATGILWFLKDSHMESAIILSAIYLVCAGYRLFRFSSAGHGDYFDGIPTTFAAPIIIFSLISTLFSSYIVFVGIVLIMSILMVSKLPYPHRHLAKDHRFLRFVQFPAFILTLLSIAMLIRGKEGVNFYVYDILVMVFCLYTVSPIIYWREAKELKNEG